MIQNLVMCSVLQYEKESLQAETPFLGIPKCTCKKSAFLITVQC